jgi:hypothetical protein
MVLLLLSTFESNPFNARLNVQYYSPAPSNPKPFSVVSNNSKTLKQLKNAELHPTPVLLSDWSHTTSEELRDIAVTANLDTMSVSTGIFRPR